MHILYLHQYFCPPGGSGNNRSFELARKWIEKGHEVTMLTSTAYFPENLLSKSDPGTVRLTLEGVKIIAIEVPYSHFMPFWHRIKAFIQFYRKAGKELKRESGFDLVYASSTPPTVGEMGRKYAQNHQLPFVFETVDVWPDTPEKMGILKNPMLISWLHMRVNMIYKDADLIVGLSPGMCETILSKRGASNLPLVENKKVFLSLNGTNPKVFEPTKRQDSKPVKVLYTGTVGFANGLDAMVRIAREIEEMGRNDIRFVVLGDGNDLIRVKGIAEKLQCSLITFQDQVPKDQVKKILDEADIGLVTFAPHKVLEENSANKFYDYAASGLPIVINYEGWQAELLEKEQMGLSSPMGDEKAFLANILRLADDFAQRQTMGQNSRRVAELKFDREMIADELLEQFERLVNQTR